MRDHLNFEKRLSFAIFFMAGILGGIFFVIKSKGSLSDHGDLFDASVLYGVKNLKADGRTLFLYIFAKRLSEMCFFALAATTYLGSLCMRGGAVWFGMTFGSYLALSTAQYGMKGFFVALTGLFPQYLIYIPVFWILFLWGENVYRGIYVY